VSSSVPRRLSSSQSTDVRFIQCIRRVSNNALYKLTFYITLHYTVVLVNKWVFVFVFMQVLMYNNNIGDFVFTVKCSYFATSSQTHVQTSCEALTLCVIFIPVSFSSYR